MKVSVIVNCCYEGSLLSRSLESANRSIKASGFEDECELIIVADSANKTTLDTLDRSNISPSRVLRTDLSDLGMARNVGVEAAEGELILFLDGDDLWCRSWIRAAWSEYLAGPWLTILHSQYSVFFGARSEILVHPDWRDPYFDPRGLVACNSGRRYAGCGRNCCWSIRSRSAFGAGMRIGLVCRDDGQRISACLFRTVHFVKIKEATDASPCGASIGCVVGVCRLYRCE